MLNSTQRGYDARWRKQRLTYLKHNPLCVYCQRAGMVEPATVVDHIVPHKGCKGLFWNVDNWQSLCKKCHDTIKQSLEKGGNSAYYGVDGWPIDLT